MPRPPILDPATLDLTHVIADQDAIRKANPHRGQMEHLTAVVYMDAVNQICAGYKDVRADEFWVPGHIPGRPLLPGVIMIEAGAQLAAFYTRKYVGWTGFIGFGGADEIRFRQPVAPGCRLHMLAQKVWQRHGRLYCKVQGLVDSSLVFEAGIVGTQV